MEDKIVHKRLETEAIHIGRAMSRLDTQYLSTRGLQTWQAAYAEAADAPGRPPNRFENLRAEFDPYHPNPRGGWLHPKMSAADGPNFGTERRPAVL